MRVFFNKYRLEDIEKQLENLCNVMKDNKVKILLDGYVLL